MFRACSALVVASTLAVRSLPAVVFHDIANVLSLAGLTDAVEGAGSGAGSAGLVPVIPTPYQVSQIAVNSFADTVRAINNFGQIAGCSNGSAFLWTPVAANAPAGTMTDIEGLEIGTAATSSAAGINDAGQVVGTTGPLGWTLTQSFLWSPSVKNGTSGTLISFLPPPLSDSVGFDSVSGLNSYG